MDITASQIIAEARTYLGTPYVHQGRLKGVGVDCIGPIILIGRDLFGIRYDGEANYTKWADGVSLCGDLDRYLRPIDPKEARPGDVLVFWVLHPSRPQHVGIKTDKGMIHSNGRCGKVVEHGLTENWVKRLTAAYRYPGVVEEEAG